MRGHSFRCAAADLYHRPVGLPEAQGGLYGYTIGLIRYAITDGVLQPDACVCWAADSVDFVQLRDKAVGTDELARRARTIQFALRGTRIKLLVNGRADVAVAVGAAGVHLTGSPDELTPAQARLLFERAGAGRPVVSISCHSLTAVKRARDRKADWILFGPVFEKRVEGDLVANGVGLAALHEACALAPGKVLALGGVTVQNSRLCMQAGAAGIAAIRMFASADVTMQ